MTTLRQAAEEALEALETLPCGDSYKTHNAAVLLIKALAECRSSELQEPPQRQWVGLTDEDMSKIFDKFDWKEIEIAGEYLDLFTFAKSIEAKLKEKNT